MHTMSRLGRLAMVALPALMLAACTTSVEQMNKANMSGDAFNQRLARDYKDFANYEAYQMYDWTDANTFAQKSMAAAQGQAVQPEDPKAWKIKGDDKMAELVSARQRLMSALAAGAATKAPAAAARAQVNYDCWVEQQEEGWQFDHINACKDGFWRAMQVVEVVPAPAPTAQAPAQRPFLVFFDWDKSVLTADARQVLDQVISRERNSTQAIHLIGHADKSGPDNYNVRLSQRRADSVKAYLTSRGIAANRITTEARGERDPLVQTADGVREPQNRRVAINLMTRAPGV
jgi:OOP family OmpA-OmpF porin